MYCRGSVHSIFFFFFDLIVRKPAPVAVQFQYIVMYYRCTAEERHEYLLVV